MKKKLNTYYIISKNQDPIQILKFWYFSEMVKILNLADSQNHTSQRDGIVWTFAMSLYTVSDTWKSRTKS